MSVMLPLKFNSTPCFLGSATVCFRSIYPREMKDYLHTKKIYTRIFIAALSVIAPSWKRRSPPSVGERLNKVWPICTMEYFSTITRNELMIHAMTWMGLEGITLNEKKIYLYNILQVK